MVFFRLPTLRSLLFSLLFIGYNQNSLAYDATWESLDSRPLPAWYDDAKFGIFIHWGVFSVPAFGTEWFWERWKNPKFPEFADFVKKSEKPGFAYPDYAHRFDALFYEPNEWATIFSKSGAQYIVLTSKHHEGFCNWDSRDIPTTWNWNSMEIGPRRDLVGELATAIKNTSSPQTGNRLRFGLYHSLFEWFNPIFHADVSANFTTQTFVDTKTMPELYDLVKRYEPELIWSDGDPAHSDYWKSKEFLAWYATNSTVADTAVWNDRWGSDAGCKHGSFWNCADRFRPDGVVEHKWENCFTIDTTSWGMNRISKYEQYQNATSLIHLLIETVAFGGNLLLNVGPAADGTIHPIFVDRLMGIGQWLTVNGEGVYGTKPWKVCQNETAANVYYTTKDEILYAHFRIWPENDVIVLECPIAKDDTEVRMLGLPSGPGLEWQTVGTDRDSRRLHGSNAGVSGIQVQLPPLTPSKIPCQHAWVLAFTNIANIKVKVQDNST